MPLAGMPSGPSEILFAWVRLAAPRTRWIPVAAPPSRCGLTGPATLRGDGTRDIGGNERPSADRPGLGI